jgi:anti-sigma factor RsiW
MFCFQAQRLLHRFLDAELDRAASMRVEAHLDACPSCRRAFSELLDLADQLHSARLPALPEGFRNRVVDRAIGAPRPAGPARVSWIPAAAAACIIMAVAWAGFRIGESYHAPQRADTIQTVLSAPIDPGY